MSGGTVFSEVKIEVIVFFIYAQVVLRRKSNEADNSERNIQKQRKVY